jgi:hypothetical protein
MILTWQGKLAMTASELSDLIINADTLEVEEHFDEIATMLRQQQAEIEALKKELALQRLFDIGQEIEDKESAIYATGYWKGIEYKRIRELTDEEIEKIWSELAFIDITINEMVKLFARAILKKANEK